MTCAYIALGSNLGDSVKQIRDAMDALNRLVDTQVTQRSALYRTVPWGVLDQPPFINAAVALDTALSPHDLLDALLRLENSAGRVRVQRNGPRTLDLDVLHMEGVELDDDRLTLPHPRMAERAFVLLPLLDVAPALVLPGCGAVAALLADMDVSGCERLTGV